MISKTKYLEFISSGIKSKINYRKRQYSSDKFEFLLKNQDVKVMRESVHKIAFKITAKCNSPCKLCYDKGLKGEDMSLKVFEDLLSKLGKNKQIILLGGEPTVRKDLIDFLKAINKSGNIPVIFTNGLKFSDKYYAESIRKHCERIIFSFDGFDPEIYRKMRRGKEQL